MIRGMERLRPRATQPIYGQRIAAGREGTTCCAPTGENAKERRATACSWQGRLHFQSARPRNVYQARLRAARLCHVACVSVGDGNERSAASFAVIGSNGCGHFEDFASRFVLVARLQDDVAAGNVGCVEPPVVRPREFGAKDIAVIFCTPGKYRPAAGKLVAPEVA